MSIFSNLLIIAALPTASGLRPAHLSRFLPQSGIRSTNPRALDLDINTPSSSSVQLTTGVYRFSWSSVESPQKVPPKIGQNIDNLTVDLFSMVHVADRSYYEAVKAITDNYDLVLYELITDNRNCELVCVLKPALYRYNNYVDSRAGDLHIC